jgi:uncharacterized protein with PQ loop repeat
VTIPELCGWLAGVLILASTLPQAVRSWQFRNDHHALLAISVFGASARVVGVLLWVAYSVVVGAWALAVTNTVMAISVSITLFFVARSRCHQTVAQP